MLRCALLLAIGLTLQSCRTASVLWAAGKNNSWSNPTNWIPNGVPTAEDDVSVYPWSEAKEVIIDIPVRVKSLQAQGRENKPIIFIQHESFQAFTVSILDTIWKSNEAPMFNTTITVGNGGSFTPTSLHNSRVLALGGSVYLNNLQMDSHITAESGAHILCYKYYGASLTSKTFSSLTVGPNGKLLVMNNKKQEIHIPLHVKKTGKITIVRASLYISNAVIEGEVELFENTLPTSSAIFHSNGTYFTSSAKIGGGGKAILVNPTSLPGTIDVQELELYNTPPILFNRDITLYNLVVDSSTLHNTGSIRIDSTFQVVNGNVAAGRIDVIKQLAIGGQANIQGPVTLRDGKFQIGARIVNDTIETATLVGEIPTVQDIHIAFDPIPYSWNNFAQVVKNFSFHRTIVGNPTVDTNLNHMVNITGVFPLDASPTFILSEGDCPSGCVFGKCNRSLHVCDCTETYNGTRCAVHSRPKAPTKTKITAFDGYIDFQWENPNPPLNTTYKVYLNGVEQEKFRDNRFYDHLYACTYPKTIPGVVYSFGIQGYNDGGEGEIVRLTAIGSTMPSKPELLVSNINASGIYLTVESKPAFPPVQYQWYCDGELVALTQEPELLHRPTKKQTHSYYVVTNNTIGSKTSNIEMATLYDAPGVPTDLRGRIENDFVLLEWKTPEDSHVLYYYVYKAGKKIRVGETLYREAAVLGQRVYDYNVSAINTGGESPPAHVLVQIPESNNRAYIGLIIGGALVTFVIIIIAAIVFVILMKRRSIQNVEKYNTLEENEEQVQQTELYAKLDEENDTQ